MSADPNNVIVTENACGACGTDAIEVSHQNFPEMRTRGRTAREAAERLASQLESALDVVVDPAHREPVVQAIADIRALLSLAAARRPAEDR